LGGQGEVAGYADACGGQEGGGEEFQQLIVAIGGFDKYLCLVFAVYPWLYLFAKG
jgi:hypothetical protein